IATYKTHTSHLQLWCLQSQATSIFTEKELDFQISHNRMLLSWLPRALIGNVTILSIMTFFHNYFADLKIEVIVKVFNILRDNLFVFNNGIFVYANYKFVRVENLDKNLE
ncbi:hypothetical protein ACJX0J_006004, partial [Zea mays]